jgi:hypothetical protein
MPGSEWAIFRLGLPGSIARIEVDTHHFKVWWFFIQHTDKKEKKIFLIYKEIHMGSGAKSYMGKGFLTYEEMCKYLTVYEEAVSYI